MYSAWSTGLDGLVMKILAYDPMLTLLPLRDANSVTKEIIMRIKCDCNCSLLSFDRDSFSVSVRTAKCLLGNLNSVDLNSPEMWTQEEANFIIQLIAYSLNMPLEFLGVVSHSLHICCYWLRSIHQLMKSTPDSRETGTDGNPDARSGQGVSVPTSSFTHLPSVMAHHPLHYLEAILFALTRFYLPQQDDPIYLSHTPLITSLSWAESVDWKMRKQAAVEDIVLDSHASKLANLAVETSSTIRIVKDRLQLSQLIVNTVDSLISSHVPLPGAAWGTLLKFLLASAHFHLTLPLPVTSALHQLLVTLAKNQSQHQPGSPGTTVASHAAQLSGGLSELSASSATSSSAGNSTFSVPLSSVGSNSIGQTASGASSLPDPARLYDTMSQMIVELLMRAWLKACASEHGPSPQMWAALQSCARQWRHRSVFAKQWSKTVVALTIRLLYIEAQNHEDSEHRSSSKNEKLSKPIFKPIVDKYDDPLVPQCMPSTTVKETWYRMLRIFGNPSALCDPHVLMTPVFTECTNDITLANRLTIAPAYLPYIYHKVLNTIGIIVDLFLGFHPSLAASGMASTPNHLYGLAGVLPGWLSENEPSSGATRTAVTAPTPVDKSKKPKAVNLTPTIVYNRSTVLMAIAEESPVRLILTQIPNVSPLEKRDNVTSVGIMPPVALSSLGPSGTPSATLTIGNMGGIQAGHSSLSSNSFPSGAGAASPASSRPLPGKSAQAGSQGLTSSDLKLDALHPTSWRHSPKANTLLNLFDYWLFEAAVKDNAVDMNVRLITARASQFPPELSFQAGRAEALAILCRILLHARRDELHKDYLTRFYICVYLGLEVDTKRQDFVLHTLLLHAVDLLRVDLPGVNILIPRIVSAVQHVLHFAKEDSGDDGGLETSIIQPKYSTIAMLRRAAIHQLASMVCIPTHFEGTIIKSMAPLVFVDTDPMNMECLRAQLSLILCEQLRKEKDSENIRMLICISFVLLQDMADQPPQKSTQRKEALLTTFGYFGQLIGCYGSLLVGSWSYDLRVVQSLLEIMTSAAYVRLSPEDSTVYRTAVQHLCQFIDILFNRKGKEHTRELHSIIVAAFSCLSVWLVEHASLLLVDATCLHTCLETVELGICGTKSIQTSDNSGRSYFKADKPLTPTSRRVQQAAEACLSSIMSLASTRTNWNYSSASVNTDSRLAEAQLVNQLVPFITDSAAQHKEAVQKLLARFSYFWSEPGIIIGLLNLSTLAGSGGQLSPNLPKALLIVRGTFGRHVWVVGMRQLPMSCTETADSTALQHKSIPPPKPWGCYLEGLLKSIELNEKVQPVYFPPGVADIPLVDADLTIIKLEELDRSSRTEVDIYKQLIDSQATAQQQLGRLLLQERIEAPFPDPATEAKPLSCKKSFNSIRLLLNHLGYLLPPDLDQNLSSGEGGEGRTNLVPPAPNVKFYPLDHRTGDFFEQLSSLDSLPTRTTDTLLVFYVAAGQKRHSEILGNMKSWSSLSVDFRSFVNRLGQQVDVKTHFGWTGTPQTSYRHSFETDRGSVARTVPRSLAGAVSQAPDGIRTIIYSANSFNELACYCPTQIVSSGATNNLPASTSDQQSGGAPPQQDPSSLDPNKNRVAVVWLERWQDGPLSYGFDCPGWSGVHRLTSQHFDCPVTIYLHPLSSGLCRVGVLRSTGPVLEAGPLVTGLLVGPTCLPGLVGQTVANLCRRWRLASDQFDLAHVHRSHLLFKMAKKFQGDEPNPPAVSETLIQLFTSTA